LFSPSAADADEVVDGAGSDRNRQMLLQELRDLTISSAFSSQSGDYVCVRFKLGSRRFLGISSSNLLIAESMSVYGSRFHCSPEMGESYRILFGSVRSNSASFGMFTGAEDPTDQMTGAKSRKKGSKDR
jgi:hypothetical protein